MNEADVKASNLLDQLLRKVLSDPSSKKKAQELMGIVTEEKKNQKEAVETHTAKHYVSVSYTISCLTCGTVCTREKVFDKKETITYVDDRGKTQIVNFRNSVEPCCISTTTTFCSHCKEFIAELPREELERRFYEFVQLSTLVWSNFLKDKRERIGRVAEVKINADTPRDCKPSVYQMTDEQFAEYLAKLDSDDEVDIESEGFITQTVEEEEDEQELALLLETEKEKEE